MAPKADALDPPGSLRKLRFGREAHKRSRCPRTLRELARKDTFEVDGKNTA